MPIWCKKIGIPVLGLALILLHWWIDEVRPDRLLFQVNSLANVSFFETKYLYCWAHLVTIVPILLLSFDRKVAYYKRWKYVFPALLIVALPFWVWDSVKTAQQVWGFNPRYYTFLVGNLPIEEWLFFITFPWASVFIYECLNSYFPTTRFLKVLRRNDRILSVSLVAFFFAVGVLFWGHLYTVTTFWTASVLLCWQFLGGDAAVRVRFYRLFPLATLAFVVINAVFTGAFTQQPIVVYNPEEYLGIRFFTIPLDDFAYNFSLQLAIIVVYERLKNRPFATK